MSSFWSGVPCCLGVGLCVRRNQSFPPLLKLFQKANEAFGINHYAGTVEYKTQNFLTKNRDAVPELFQTLMHVRS